MDNKCKLICEHTKDQQLLGIYNKVREKDVGVKFYTQEDNLTNLKGQIKVNQNGIKEAIFTQKTGKGYSLIKVENQFLVSTILERYIEVYNSSAS